MNKIENGKKISENLELDSTNGKKSRFKKLVIIIVIIVAVILGLSLIGGENNGSVEMYKTELITMGNLTVTVDATGSLKPRNQVDVGSELSGIVKTVEVDFNDHVTKGQVLATLDISKLTAQVKQSKASLEAAEAKILDSKATVKEAQNELNRLRQVWELSNKKIPSQNDLETAEAVLQRAIASEASAKAQISQARATLEANETDLGKMVIKSPVNGIVLNRAIEPGQTVAASFQAPVLFTLAEDLTKMELSVDVDEADVGMVKNEQDATFTVDAYPNQSFNAKILQVKYGSTATEGVVTYETLLLVDNEELLLRPGMTATAEIIVNRIENTILIPNAALRFEPSFVKNAPPSGAGQRSFISRLMPGPPGRFANRQQQPEKKENGIKTVWALKDNQPVSVTITTGPSDGNMTQVMSGDLKPGMSIITGSIGQ